MGMTIEILDVHWYFHQYIANVCSKVVTQHAQHNPQTEPIFLSLIFSSFEGFSLLFPTSSVQTLITTSQNRSGQDNYHCIVSKGNNTYFQGAA